MDGERAMSVKKKQNETYRKLLHVVLVIIKIIRYIEDVVSEGTHALGAIDIAEGGITYTPTSLSSIPRREFESLRICVEPNGRVISPCSTKGHVLNIFTSSMTTAIVRAGGTGTALTLIAIEALALTSSTITDASSSALHVLVELSLLIRGIYPSQLVRADTLRTISRVVSLANAPVIVAGADIVCVTRSMPTAVVVARGVGSGGKKCQ
jgi:hypothetical protein